VKEGERGAVLVIFALAWPLFLLLASFMIDRGIAEIKRVELQTAADAAAMAGAAALPNVGVAVSESRTYLELNGADPRSLVLVGNGTVFVRTTPVRVGRFVVIAEAKARSGVGVLGIGRGRAVLVGWLPP
jgi:uncharacterized membrane protein